MMGSNTLWVLCGVISLSAACALIGYYTMLFRQSLTTDAVSHATLPGVAIGFFASYYLGLDNGRFLPLLLLGAALTGGLCSYLISFIISRTRLSEDTAIAATLSVFFGLGILLLSIIQNMEGGNRSGLDSFLLGQVSGLTFFDVGLITLISVAVITIAALHHKRFMLYSFDQSFGQLSDGKTRQTLFTIASLILIIVCVGLKTAGAVLILAMLIIPPASARLLSDNTKTLLTLSVCCGVICASIGALLSAYGENIPTGAAIVCVNASFFILCLIFSSIKNLKPRHAL